MFYHGNLVGLIGNQMFEERPMTCKDFIGFLHEYLEGELPADERALFEEHLSLCVSCVNYLSNYRDTIRLAQASLKDSDEPVSDDVPEELIAAILTARKTGGR
jgi:anti-sigma factor RsiW